MARLLKIVASAVLAIVPALAQAQGAPLSADEAARRFGALESVRDIAISPDGKRLAYIEPGPGGASLVAVASLDGSGVAKRVLRVDLPWQLNSCGWASNDRMVCNEWGIFDRDSYKVPVSRLFSVNADGTDSRMLMPKMSVGTALRDSYSDGYVVDWLDGSDANVLVTRDFVPQQTTGSFVANTRDGLGVVKLDTRTLKANVVETANALAGAYVSDGRGAVRLMAISRRTSEGMLKGEALWRYRKAGQREWLDFSVVKWKRDDAFQPLAIDPALDVAYALKPLDGRQALYRVKLDGSLAAELVYANPYVDIDSVVSIGRRGRVIGATYATDKRHVEYFDPAFRALGESLSKALPGSPIIGFVSASADENRMVVFAGSDNDPGSFYLLDRTTKALGVLMPSRPELAGVPLANVKPITYRASDGTSIPAYLTLPPAAFGKPVGAIVMPHGGPEARDEWTFDWLAQFFAQRGYAVLQPNFRGSSGYGNAWFKENGFKSWKLAIGDVAAGGRYLIDQKIVAPDKLAIVGWSYGGYAALQSAVFEPGLFKAVAAVAPVTDLARLKADGRDYADANLLNDYIGSGPHIVEGSPAQRAAEFTVPVVMFHGNRDLNVDIGQSQLMLGALKRAGKQAELVEFPGLDHQLHDPAARAKLLATIDAFLRSNLKIAP